MYTIETKLASKNGWDNPDEARRRYGKYARDGVTCHWWNTPDKAGTHDQTVSYILGQAQAGNMSVHYVVSDAKVTLLVSPDNVAWHATAGNPTTIGIEFDPRLSAEGYRRGGWLISELEGRYGKPLKLYKHSDWQGTACPGTIDVPRLRREADAYKQLPQGGTMALNPGFVTNVYRYVGGREPTAADVEFHSKSSTPESLMDGFIRNNDLALPKTREALADAQKAIAIRNQEIAELKAKLASVAPAPSSPANPQDTADAEKWRQLKSTMKELLT